MSKKIAIIGAGRIGRTLAFLRKDTEFTLVDKDISGLPPDLISHAVVGDATSLSFLDEIVEQHDAVVSAAPFHVNKRIAAACAIRDKSYFDFTEDTATTSFIKGLANGTTATFVPQCGLAPGFINIVAADVIAQFDRAVSVDLRVGALPQFPNNRLKYYRSWSTAGLVNEYIQPCDALVGGVAVKMRAMEGLEEITIGGASYEAFNTSGGVATMVETYAGKVWNLNYKTMRYPGHNDYMRFLLDDMGFSNRPDELIALLDGQCPETDQDVVVVYVNVVGVIGGKLTQKTFTKTILPVEIDGRLISAIEFTTAGGMAAVLEMWEQGQLPAGFVAQESIDFAAFMSTTWGSAAYS